MTNRPRDLFNLLRCVGQGIATSRSFRYRAPWEGLCRSITAGTDNSTKPYVHPLHHREISVREYARIHGFPDSWDFKGTRCNGLKGIANAVPVQLVKPVIEAAAKVLLQEIEIDVRQPTDTKSIVGTPERPNVSLS